MLPNWEVLTGICKQPYLFTFQLGTIIMMFSVLRNRQSSLELICHYEWPINLNLSRLRDFVIIIY